MGESILDVDGGTTSCTGGMVGFIKEVVVNFGTMTGTGVRLLCVANFGPLRHSTSSG